MLSRTLIFAVSAGLLFAHSPARCATAGLALEPGRMEVEVNPGAQKTVSFNIESPPSDDAVRGRLLLSLTDWSLGEDGSLAYNDPGTSSDSAARWITFSPTAVSISSGQRSLVRVTIDVPKETSPGTYKAGIFVQERPPASPPQKGDHTVMFRFRYVEVIYVIVPPVQADPHLIDAGLSVRGTRLNVFYSLRNDGSGLSRFFASWVLRNQSGRVVTEEKPREGTVLLPRARLTENTPIEAVEPGKYELTVSVDFKNGAAIQALTRTVDVAPSAAPPQP